MKREITSWVEGDENRFARIGSKKLSAIIHLKYLHPNQLYGTRILGNNKKLNDQ